MTLIDVTADPVKLPADHPFLGVTPSEYWTITRAQIEGLAFTVDLGTGSFNSHGDYNAVSRGVWCVRSDDGMTIM